MKHTKQARRASFRRSCWRACIDRNDPRCTDCGAYPLRAYSITSVGGRPIAAHCARCEERRTLRRYAATRRLGSGLVIVATIQAFGAREARNKVPCDPRWLEIADATERLQALLKRVDREVWFGGLQSLANAWPTGLTSAPFPTEAGPAELLVSVSAGRALVTVRADGAEVTAITAATESTSRMGLQDVAATEQQATELLTGAIAAWSKGLALAEAPTRVG